VSNSLTETSKSSSIKSEECKECYHLFRA